MDDRAEISSVKLPPPVRVRIHVPVGGEAIVRKVAVERVVNVTPESPDLTVVPSGRATEREKFPFNTNWITDVDPSTGMS